MSEDDYKLVGSYGPTQYVSREGCIKIPAATENTQENVLALRAL